ncbi:MAG: hypothetical protein KDJ38_15160 [Gammaproteobacteria bacterium]|nr:hypothetical protein [Gammaproteobacteria bacterium]
MKFGLVVTDERNLEAASAMLDEALARGWESRCFLTDRGVLLLLESRFTDSPAFSVSHVAVCELSIERYEDHGLHARELESMVIVGGQYQNAELVRNSDRVVVL